MKKRIYLLFVALLAVSSFTLVSCSSDDDDELSTGGNGEFYCSLTVNGETFKGKYISGEIYSMEYIPGGIDYLGVAINTPYLDDIWFSFAFCGEGCLECMLIEGVDITDKTRIFGSIQTESVDDSMFYTTTEGSLIVLDYVESEYIELEFKDCRIYNNFTQESTVVNGKVKAPMKGFDVVVGL